MDRTRDAKRPNKTEAVAASIPYKAEVVAGSTDYVDFLQNKRDSYFWISGVYFCNAPMKIDLKFQTVDAPNAGSVLFDVVRAMKLSLERNLTEQLNPSVLTRLNIRRKLFRWKLRERNSRNSSRKTHHWNQTFSCRFRKYCLTKVLYLKTANSYLVCLMRKVVAAMMIVVFDFYFDYATSPLFWVLRCYYQVAVCVRQSSTLWFLTFKKASSRSLQMVRLLYRRDLRTWRREERFTPRKNRMDGCLFCFRLGMVGEMTLKDCCIVVRLCYQAIFTPLIGALAASNNTWMSLGEICSWLKNTKHTGIM